ncbi:MAG: ribosome small subunit-dependent GTPase A [Bacteroidales bacterium]|jgi:ribosome biogenesis GTPase|nr:ribosome small subunit-dependent GTPase A [Bacteroidales bacterium]
MNLEEIGYNERWQRLGQELQLADFTTGRVVAEHKKRYVVKTPEGDVEAEITGNMRFTATSREDFPAVGDWVALSIYDSDSAIIHQVYPRNSLLKRQAVGKYGEVQVIAANIDTALIVQSVDRDFNINRTERYLTLCYDTRINPVIVLTKTDLVNEQQLSEKIDQIKKRNLNVPVIAISNITPGGYQTLETVLEKGKTYCMLGSSGAGKSTLMNNLAGKASMKTGPVSQSTHKGQHITSHRELILINNGAILIDNPGMREVGLTDTSQGLATTFDQICRLAENCKFSDCTHTSETGCAVLRALENEELDKDAYQNFLKMEREKAYFESSLAEKRRKDKDFGKMVKNIKKDLKKLKKR